MASALPDADVIVLCILLADEGSLVTVSYETITSTELRECVITVCQETAALLDVVLEY